MTRILPLAARDFEDWLPLWHGYLEFYEHELTAEQTMLTFDRLTDPGFPAWGALARDAEGRAIGFVNWLTHPSTWAAQPYCYLEDLFVAPDVRGSGAGRALIETVTTWARERGCAEVYWLTAEKNATARALYDRVAERTGFIHYGIPLDGD
ncbi:GNAT family N-acetyltransferase [Microbacterium deminutum]|uniref:GNAT family N-acetyltransferase n=1 Tax=Microbacterium deminutum TaxID=344164 RepID=A0ABN2RAP9_9MICO